MSIKSIDERLAGYQPLWENWFLDCLIYNGANSRVYKIKRNRDGEDEYAAMKAVSITLDNELFISGEDSIKYLDDRCSNAKAEIKNMIKLQRSPYIVSYYDDVTKEIIDDTGAKCGYDILIRMEYLDCFGTKIRKKELSVTTQDVLNLAYDIGSALLDVHKNKMIHRDIKPDNIFIDDLGYYKLGDLGVTKSINATGYASTRTGTEPYAAPEVWRSESYTQAAYTYKADIYSFGLVLYQLMNNNYLPFMNEFTHNELEKSISMRMRGEQISPPVNGSEQFKKIICKMCQFDPDNRFSDMSEFLNALSEVGKRSDSNDQSDDLDIKPGNPADEIPTLDANEGCAVYKQIDDTPPAEVDIGTYMPVVGADTDYIDQNLSQKTPDQSVSKPDSISFDQKSAESEPDDDRSVSHAQTDDTENIKPAESDHTDEAENIKPAQPVQTDETENVKPAEPDHTDEAENIKPAHPVQTDETENVKPAEPVHTDISVNEKSVESEQHDEQKQSNVQQISQSPVKNTDNINSDFQTYQGKSSAECLFSEDTVFHTFPAQCAAVNQINAAVGNNKKIIISDDGVFRKEDYHRVRVRDGLLIIPKGYFSVAPFTLYKIERDLITQIQIPKSVTTFENNAFRDLTNLKKINIAGDVMIIRSNLFSGCVSLETVVLPLSTRKIEDYAFEGCTSLKSVDARGYITGIGKNAFVGCDNVVIKCRENSFMHKYCIKYNIRTEFVDGETGE